MPGKTLVSSAVVNPIVRDDLPQIVAAAKKWLPGVQLNTNGIRLAEDEGFVRSLAEAGLSFVFMQSTACMMEYTAPFSGRDLLDVKRRAIDNCARHNLGVTPGRPLCPESTRRILGIFIRFAVSQSPAVRGVHPARQLLGVFQRCRRMIGTLMNCEQFKQAGDLAPDDSLGRPAATTPVCVPWRLYRHAGSIPRPSAQDINTASNDHRGPEPFFYRAQVAASRLRMPRNPNQ